MISHQNQICIIYQSQNIIQILIKKKIRNKSAFSLTRAHLSKNINDYNKGKLLSEDQTCKVYSGLGINGEIVTIKEYINLSFNKKNSIFKNKKKNI